MTTPPPLPNVVFIRVDALEAALTKLKVTGITAAQLIHAVYEEERNIAAPCSPGAVPKLIKDILPGPSFISIGSDDAGKALRFKLRDIARKAFPDGKIPDPYTTPWLTLDDAERDLPFIQATVTVSPYEWPDGTPEPAQTFRDVRILWDTGAQVSQILSSELRDDIKIDGNGVVQTSGFAAAKVTFTGFQQEIATNIAFRPIMPNGATFIILGQQTLLNCIKYGVEPIVINPSLKDMKADAYGQIDLQFYRNPVYPDAPLQLFTHC